MWHDLGEEHVAGLDDLFSGADVCSDSYFRFTSIKGRDAIEVERLLRELRRVYRSRLGRHDFAERDRGRLRYHVSILSKSFISRWILSSKLARSARISFGGRCSITSCTTSRYRLRERS